MHGPQFDNIPEELKERPQWVLWRTIPRAGKPTKVPYDTTGREGDSSNPARWESYDVVVDAYQKGGYDGIGYTFDVLDPYAGIDLDHCITDTGGIKPKAKEILDKLNTYSEISPSGTGIKAFLKAKNPVNIHKKDGKFQQGFKSKTSDLEIEIYFGNRFFTLTGNRLPDYPATIEDRHQELTEVFKEVFKDRRYFDEGRDPGPQGKRTENAEPLSSSAAERLQELFDTDPDFKTELFTPAPIGQRSDAEFHLCARLWEAGFTESEIYVIMTSSPQTKWQERSDSYRWDTIKSAVGKVEASHQPGLRMLPLKKDEIDAGEVGVCQITGAVKQMIKMKSVGEDGAETSSKFLAWISDCAVYIDTETNAKDDGEFFFKGVGAIDKRAVEFTLPSSALAEPRKFRAACINFFGARNRFGNLNFEIVQQITMHPKRMQRVEVPTWRENIPLLPGVDLVDKTEFRLSPKIPAAVYDGDLDKAKDCLRKLLRVHKYAPILVATVLGAPAVARWRKNDRFSLGLWGITGALKTTTALTAMGVYGTGYLDGPKLKAGKAGSTSVGAMEVFAAAGFLPQVFDDVKTVDAKDNQNFVAVIHGVLEGDEKARGKKDGGLRESREFLCTPIVTGEVRPQEASTTARGMNLNWTRPNVDLLSEVQKNAALLPVIGYHWFRFLSETDYVIGKDFEAFRSKKMEEFLGLRYTNPGRLATIYSLLVSVWDLLEASPLGDVFTEAHESFKAALQEATAVQGQAVSEETEISRFLAALEELIASNPGLIASKEGKKTIMGSIIGKEMEKGIFLLPTETLNELMRIKAFNQQPTIDSITQALNDKGLLIHTDEGRLKFQSRFNGAKVRGWYIKREVSPPESEMSPATGDSKTDSNGSSVPGVPGVPGGLERENLSENLQKNRDRFIDEKQNQENAGDNGDSGDRERENRDIDIDFDSKVSVPSSVPGEQNDGDISSSECGIGPHPLKDAPTPPAKEDPGFQKFKAKSHGYKHVCKLCGTHFEQALVISGFGGYICSRCHREDSPLAEPAQADSQTKLGSEAGA
jgi:hypothetical protein